MKTYLWIVISLIINNAYSQVQNPGFEKITNTSPVKVPRWNWQDSKYKINIDSANAYSGKYSISIDGTNQSGYSSFSQYIPMKTDRVKKYRLSAYMKYENIANGFVGLFINVQGNNQMIYFDNMASLNLVGSEDWKKYTVEFIADEKVEYIFIGGNLAGSGKSWFDEFAIEEIKENPQSEVETLFFNEVLSILKNNSIKKDSLNFEDLETRIKMVASGSKSTRDCYPTLKYILNKLGDNHTHLMEPEVKSKWKQNNISTNTLYPTSEILDTNIGYISIPQFSSGNSVQITKYVDSLQSLIKTTANKNSIKGWIIDLRQNRGGNAYAMLAGIGPILGNGTCGYFIKPDGKNTTPFFYKDGKAGYGNKVMAQSSTKKNKAINDYAPVAILTSNQTESAGEVLTVAFKQRKKTKSFGEPTAGNTTNNDEFELSDGSIIFLATSYFADRNKNIYMGKINPDFKLDKNEQTKSTDLLIEKAISWIRNMPDE